MKRYPWVAGVAAATLLAATACGSGDDNDNPPTSSGEMSTIAGLEHVDAKLVTDAKAEGTVEWYTTNAEDISIEFAEEFEQLTGIEVNVFQKTSAPLLESLLAEVARRDVKADVIGFTDATAFLELVKADVVAEYQPAGLDQYSADALGMKPHGYPYHVVLPSILYNTDHVKGADVDVLDDLTGLTDPRFRGQVGMPDPALTGFGFNSHWLYRQMVGEAAYRTFLEGLKANQVRWFSSGTAAADALSGGEISVAWLADSQGVQASGLGAPVAISYKPAKLPAYFGVIGVVNDGPNPNAGKLFLTYMLSKVGQENWMKHYNAGSANTKAVDPRSQSSQPWYADYRPDKLFFNKDPEAQAQGREALLGVIKSVFPEIGG